MNWLRNITTTEQYPTHRRIDQATGVRAAAVERESREVSPQHNGYTYEYAFDTKLTVGTTFYANQAQLPGRSKLAERAVVELVFQPYLMRRSRLMHAIHDCNKEEALELLQQIDREIGA